MTAVITAACLGLLVVLRCALNECSVDGAVKEGGSRLPARAQQKRHWIKWRRIGGWIGWAAVLAAVVATPLVIGLMINAGWHPRDWGTASWSSSPVPQPAAKYSTPA